MNNFCCRLDYCHHLIKIQIFSLSHNIQSPIIITLSNFNHLPFGRFRSLFFGSRDPLGPA
jgi:hypothetical protein